MARGNKTPPQPLKVKGDVIKYCKLADCNRQMTRKSAKGLCRLHYQRLLVHGDPYKMLMPYKRHGLSKKNSYDTWLGMKQRCYDRNSNTYLEYGGRGIKICGRWLNSFENFYKDMGDKPSSEHSIERKDNDGDYEPSNCKWATKSEQMNNRRLFKNNTSGFKGVYLRLPGKWQASVCINGKNKHLGYFTNINEAVKARKEAELKYFDQRLISYSNLDIRTTKHFMQFF